MTESTQIAFSHMISCANPPAQAGPPLDAPDAAAARPPVEQCLQTARHMLRPEGSCYAHCCCLPFSAALADGRNPDVATHASKSPHGSSLELFGVHSCRGAVKAAAACLYLWSYLCKRQDTSSGRWPPGLTLQKAEHPLYLGVVAFCWSRAPFLFSCNIRNAADTPAVAACGSLLRQFLSRQQGAQSRGWSMRKNPARS